MPPCHTLLPAPSLGKQRARQIQSTRDPASARGLWLAGSAAAFHGESFMSVASRPFNPLIEGDDDLVVAGG